MIMESGDEGEKEESKSARKHKKNGSRREPLEDDEDKPASKGSLSASKLANKRSQKEALKKKKMKRNKGTVKDELPAGEQKAAKARSNSK